MLDASAKWDELIKSGASDVELKKHLAKLAEILSESSYIRNLEAELEKP